MILSGWYILSETASPSLYHKVPILVFEVLQMLWWLAAWPSLAWAASVISACSAYSSYGIFTDFCVAYPLIATAAGLAAVEWYTIIYSQYNQHPNLLQGFVCRNHGCICPTLRCFSA
jgi:hypothetical protein